MNLIRNRFAIYTKMLALLLALVVTGSPMATAEDAAVLAAQNVALNSDQLDSLVAPIALYPDNLLSQVLVASTYPLEIIQLQQWLRSEEHTSELQSPSVIS